ncbi:MAG TPA: hypothetical protein VFB41_02800 [Solirubrobacteraceae bacterium]|nr:hypothetical protein [Solirubrobacteraceae bacterium]
MSTPSLWSDEQSSHSWLPATADVAAEPASPTEEHERPAPVPSRVSFPVLLIVACTVGAAVGAVAELLR